MADLLNVSSVPKELHSTQQQEQVLWLSKTQNSSVLPFSLQRWAPLQWDQRPGRVVVYSDAWWCSGACRNLWKQDILGSEMKLNLKRNTTWIFIMSTHHLINCKISSTTCAESSSEVNIRSTKPSRTPRNCLKTSTVTHRRPTALLSCFSKLRTSTRSKEPLPLSLKLSVGALRCATSLSMVERQKWWKNPSIISIAI